MNATSTRRVKVEAGGTGVVAHVGLHALGSLADRLGVGDLLSARIPVRSERAPLHDRGKVLVQSALMIAGGELRRHRTPAFPGGAVPLSAV
jgi:hypothetical protein